MIYSSDHFRLVTRNRGVYFEEKNGFIRKTIKNEIRENWVKIYTDYIHNDDRLWRYEFMNL